MMLAEGFLERMERAIRICHAFNRQDVRSRRLNRMSNLQEIPVARRLSESGMPPPPLVAVPAYTDGFLFTKIRYGKPGMPGYPQIAPEDRWHIVNYLRTMKVGG